MNLPAFPPKCRSRRKRLPSHLTSSGGTVRAAGYRKPFGERLPFRGFESDESKTRRIGAKPNSFDGTGYGGAFGC
jgi:hypothetical protein